MANIVASNRRGVQLSGNQLSRFMNAVTTFLDVRRGSVVIEIGVPQFVSNVHTWMAKQSAWRRLLKEVGGQIQDGREAIKRQLAAIRRAVVQLRRRGVIVFQESLTPGGRPKKTRTDRGRPRMAPHRQPKHKEWLLA